MPVMKRPGQPDIHYVVDDCTDPWKKAPVLLLQHGFGRSHRVWYSWVPYLSRYFRVIRPDLRGLGGSSKDFDLRAGITLDAYLADLADLVRHVGADAVHYCGESLGGIIGMAFAATHPALVKTLTTISCPVDLHGKDQKASSYGYSSRSEALRRMGARGWAEASNAGRRFPKDADPGMMKWFVDEMGESDVEVLVATYEWASSISARPYLSRIACPMLGLYPVDGPIAGDDQIEILKREVREIDIVRIPLPYHAINTLRPAMCARAVLHFAARVEGMPCIE